MIAARLTREELIKEMLLASASVIAQMGHHQGGKQIGQAIAEAVDAALKPATANEIESA